MSKIASILVAFLAGYGAVASVWADAPGAIDFTREIQPVFVRHCTQCHGVDKREAGLRLDAGTGLRTGGDSGPAVVPGKPEASRLVLAITGGTDEISRMPPEGPLLSAAEVDRIRTWIEQGAEVPAPTKGTSTAPNHWAFQRPGWPKLPAAAHNPECRSPIDAFIQDELAAAGLTPAPEAESATLIRRLYLDLLGLPPSVEDVRAFAADERPDAYLRLVDRLLSSPAYGERWGRHWLDAARYADSNGYTRDFGREIWKYREWVIQAVNADQPFDQFTVEQFAGDLLAGATQDQRIATGFHRNTLINEEGGTDPEQFRVDAVADRLATTGEVYLGLTLGCARCHSHKYDPISQREYYQLFAFLNNCDEPTVEVPFEWQVSAGLLERRAAIRDQIAALEQQVEQQRAELEAKQRAWEKTITPMQRARLPGPVQVAFDMAFDKRDAANKKTIEEYYRKSPVGRGEFPVLDQIARLREREPKIPQTLVMAERAERRRTHVHRRGDFLDLGEEVSAAVPAALHPLPPETPAAPTRLDLARWLVSPDNPLTPRVIMNRHWLVFFGRGIVETENDFGTQGAAPTHPSLLDWLGLEWVRRGWSVKQMHREIVLSATYRQASLERPDVAQVDPANRLYARQSRLRLDAEIIRDAALEAAGLLTRQIGGPSVYPPQPEGVFEFTQDPKPWPTATNADRYRRGLYTYFWRSSPYPALMVFDAPNGNVTCTRRLRSNTPLQALTLANDVQFVECARGLAWRVLTESSADPGRQLTFAFQTCLGRKPSALEHRRLEELLERQWEAYADDSAATDAILGERSAAEDSASAPEDTASAAGNTATRAEDTAAGERVDRTAWAAWTAVCRVLLNLDEFITRE